MNGLTPEDTENTEWPTPETNAKASNIIGFFSCATVPSDFARKMEHQRNEENKKLNIATEQWELTINLCQKLERELNEKASVARNLEIALSAVSNLAAELKAERDEATLNLTRICSAAERTLQGMSLGYLSFGAVSDLRAELEQLKEETQP